MNAHFLLALSLSAIVLSPAIAGFVTREGVSRRPEPTVAQPAPRPPNHPRATSPDQTTRDIVGEEKAVLGRLIAELQRSPRSFLYLRAVGFTQTDEEFERLIGKNNALFQRTRIVRRDEEGQRQIPGWPGVTLSPEFKISKR